MRTFETDIIVEDPSRIVLDNTPFQRGEKIHVIIQPQSEILDRKRKQQEAWKQLQEEMEKNKEFQKLTEAEIAAEIAAYRRGE